MKKYDPKTNRECNQPFPTPEAANDAMLAFMKDVEAARVKHKMADVYVIISGSCLYPSAEPLHGEEPEEGTWINSGWMGRQERMLALTAWAYGYEQAQNRQLMNTIINKAGASIKVK